MKKIIIIIIRRDNLTIQIYLLTRKKKGWGKKKRWSIEKEENACFVNLFLMNMMKKYVFFSHVTATTTVTVARATTVVAAAPTTVIA